MNPGFNDSPLQNQRQIFYSFLLLPKFFYFCMFYNIKCSPVIISKKEDDK